MKDYKLVRRCRVCKSKRLHSYLRLGNQPLSNSLQETQEAKPKKYPLEVLYCKNCSLSQLSIVVNPKTLYSNYLYRSSMSNTFKEHCYQMALRLRRLFKKTGREFPAMMDIAANDGALMREFRRAGFIVFGVEPAKNLAGKPDFENILVIVNDFWSYKLAKRWSVMGKHRDFITATNVFAHVDDIDDFLRGVKDMLLPDGVFVMEVPYLVDIIEKVEFDTIYHEHLSYFLLKPLVRLFKRHGLPIFRVERYPVHGGTIRVYASNKGRKVHSSVDRLLKLEKSKGFHKFSTYSSFASRIEDIKVKIFTKIIDLHLSNKKIMGYGASAKGANLLNYFGITKISIHSVVDDTPEKQGKFMPESSIPIVPFSHFEKEKPDYILLLAWNFAEELRDKTKHLGAKYIIPIPKLAVV